MTHFCQPSSATRPTGQATPNPSVVTKTGTKPSFTLPNLPVVTLFTKCKDDSNCKDTHKCMGPDLGFFGSIKYCVPHKCKLDSECRGNMVCKQTSAVLEKMPATLAAYLKKMQVTHFCQPPSDGKPTVTPLPITGTKPSPNGNGGTMARCKIDDDCKDTHKCVGASVGTFSLKYCAPHTCKVDTDCRATNLVCKASASAAKLPGIIADFLNKNKITHICLPAGTTTPLQTGQCRGDSDCKTGGKCRKPSFRNGPGKCFYTGTCTNDATVCKDGTTCRGGKCVMNTGNVCTSDSSCAEGEYCKAFVAGFLKIGNCMSKTKPTGQPATGGNTKPNASKTTPAVTGTKPVRTLPTRFPTRTVPVPKTCSGADDSSCPKGTTCKKTAKGPMCMASLRCPTAGCGEGKTCKTLGGISICVASPLPLKTTMSPATKVRTTNGQSVTGDATAQQETPTPSTRARPATPTVPTGCDLKCQLAQAKKDAADANAKVDALDKFNKERAAQDKEQLEYLKAKLAKAQSQDALKKLMDQYNELKADSDASADSKNKLAIQLAQAKQDWADKLAAERKQNAAALEEALAALKKQMLATQDTETIDNEGATDTKLDALQLQISALTEEIAATNKKAADATTYGAMNAAKVKLLEQGKSTDAVDSAIEAVENGEGSLDVNDSSSDGEGTTDDAKDAVANKETQMKQAEDDTKTAKTAATAEASASAARANKLEEDIANEQSSDDDADDADNGTTIAVIIAIVVVLLLVVIGVIVWQSRGAAPKHPNDNRTDFENPVYAQAPGNGPMGNGNLSFTLGSVHQPENDGYLTAGC